MANILRNQLSTYCYRVGDVTPAATPTDVLTITGVSGKVIRVHKVGVSGVATAAALVDVYLLKRTTANSGGTATNPTPTPFDILSPASKAVVSLYTANPASLGTGLVLEANRLYLPAAGTPTAAPTLWEREFGLSGAENPTLRSATDTLSINFAGATLGAGSSFYLYLEWTENDS